MLEAVASEHPPDSVPGDGYATPALVLELKSDSVWPKARVSEGEGDHLLLDLVGDGVRHLGSPALSRAQDVRPVALQQLPPAVKAGGMDLHHSAGVSHTAELLGQRDYAQAESEQNVIIGHGGASSAGLGTTHRMAPPLTSEKPSVSRLLGDRTS
jgi:hypothetical protein